MISYQLLVSLISWFLLVALFWKILRSRYNVQYSEKELVETKDTPEEFPSWYSPLYYSLIVSCLVASIGFMFLFPYLILFLQKVLYFSPEMVLFSANNTYIFAVAPSLLLGLILSGVIVNYLLSFFPKFDHYSTIKELFNSRYTYSSAAVKKEAWQKALKNVNLKKLTLSQWRPFLQQALVILCIAGPVYALAMDNYIALTQDKVIVNSFLDLKETHYPIADIKIIRVMPDAHIDTDNESTLSPKFELEFTNGKKVDLWGGIGIGSPSPEKLIKTADLLREKNVPFEVDSLDSDLEISALNAYAPEDQEKVKKVFNHIERF